MFSITQKTPGMDKIQGNKLINNLYNIASRAAQSDSVYVSVLQISIVLADGVSKSLCRNLFFSREQPLLAWGKIFRYFATKMDKKETPTTSPKTKTISDLFSWAIVLKLGRKTDKQRKRRLGISAVSIRLTVRG